MAEIKITSKTKAKENQKAKEDLEKLSRSAREDEEKAKQATAEREERERIAREEAERKRQEELAKKEEARKRAEEAKEQAEKERQEREDEVKKKAGNVALAAGGVVLNELAKKDTSAQQKKKILLLCAAILLVCGLGYMMFIPQIAQLLGYDKPAEVSVPLEEPEEEEPTPEEVLGYTKIDFTNAVLGKAREESKLIVMEQDVEVESEISNALANIALFKKTKKIHTIGTGYYTVDLNGFSDANVEVDMDLHKVTIHIPHTVLDHTKIDPGKTTFEETDHAIFGFGEIKLTQEQQNILDQSIQEAIDTELNKSELYEKADEIACLKVRELFHPVVSAVSDEFITEVVQD